MKPREHRDAGRLRRAGAYALAFIAAGLLGRTAFGGHRSTWNWYVIAAMVIGGLVCAAVSVLLARRKGRS